LKPYCILLDTGECLFAETSGMINGDGLLDLRIPYSAQIDDDNLRVSPWIPFSSMLDYKIPSSKIVTITPLDRRHKTIYSAIVIKDTVADIKSRIHHDIHVGIPLDYPQYKRELFAFLSEMHHNYGTLPPSEEKIGEDILTLAWDSFEMTPTQH